MSEMTDRIDLTGIRGFGFHGVFEEERANGQEFIVDISIYCDLREAGLGDDLAATIHYGELAMSVHRLIEGDPVDLIEALAERIASEVLRHKRVEKVSVTVHKPSAPIPVPFADVAVSITRNRE
jgi:dihydroneopterin aldolase